MIESGLPYDIEQMGDIGTNGAIVHLNDIHFPDNLMTPENKIKTALIYLRNTGFNNITLDFTGVSKEDRFKYLELYLTSNIESTQQIFAESWSKIFNYATGLNTEAKCILTDEEVEEFIQTHFEMIGKALQLIISLPLYLIKRLKVDETDEGISIGDFTKSDEKPIKNNLIHILKIPGIMLLFTHQYDFEPLNYTEIFNLENEKLFEEMMDTTFGLAMSCIINMTEQSLYALFTYKEDE